MTLRLQLPTIQNWSCHNCSGCCREHLIEITEEERQRIAGQNWTAEDGVTLPPVVRFGWGKRRYRLAHQPDGACVFLDEKGLCRIHARFGEAAKPLACRLYPFTFHPAEKGLTISLRFSCPSVVKNLGKPVTQRQRELRHLAEAALPAEVRQHLGDLPPPTVNARQHLDWKDFRRFVTALDEEFAPLEIPFVVRLLRALHWMDLVRQSNFGKIRGARLIEYLQLIRQAAQAEVPLEQPNAGEDEQSPSRLGRLYFRLLVFQYARKDTFAERDWKHRLRLLRAGIRFAQGRGEIPPVQKVFPSVPFERVEHFSSSLPPEAEEIFTRYFRVKIQGLHFCGPAYYGVSLTEGFHSLALIYPVVLWLARWKAAGEKRGAVTTDDLVTALTTADHHHGFSPLFGSRAFRRRVKHLAQQGDIAKLCRRYGR